jgi:hypothetical protein
MEKQKPEELWTVNVDACQVIDKAPPGINANATNANANAYDFRNGVLRFNVYWDGSGQYRATAIAIKDLQEDGQARALEMFAKLPASANCKPPKFTP